MTLECLKVWGGGGGGECLLCLNQKTSRVGYDALRKSVCSSLTLREQKSANSPIAACKEGSVD